MAGWRVAADLYVHNYPNFIMFRKMFLLSRALPPHRVPEALMIDLTLLQVQNEILRMIADGETLAATARRICAIVEAKCPGVMCSIVTLDRAGLLRPLAAPSLPDQYSNSLDGLMIGPDAGSCGRAAYFRETVMTEDFRRMARFAHIFRPLFALGLNACWSFPVLDTAGEAVAVLSIYSPKKRPPEPSERKLARTCVELCAIALRRNNRILDRERRASIDALTKLPNRLAFNAAMDRLLCDEAGSWALFVLDLDNLKTVNDTFGHLAGDALIRAASARISRVMAPDVTFRLGGDEFAIIIQASEALADLGSAAERILEELDAPALCEGHAVIPRATIGGAVLSATETTARAVNEAADFALYHAKETGRGGFVRYWPGIGTRMTRQRDAIRDVKEALAEGKIEAHYQPIVRLDSCEVTGLEALCRMRTSNGDLVTAEAFQEAMTDARAAVQITDYMLETIARDTRLWLDEGLAVQHVGINVSTADFYAGSISRKLEAAFARERVPLSHLVLEVSEDVYIGRRDRVVAREIQAIREGGVLVALDDFGTGYASLTHLLTAPIDIIKIDQSFVSRLGPSDPSMAIVEGLIGIAQQLGIRVVAEGVETQMQRSQLSKMGCNLGQGYAFAAAADRDRTAARLRCHAQGIAGVTPLNAGATAPGADAALAIFKPQLAAVG